MLDHEEKIQKEADSRIINFRRNFAYPMERQKNRADTYV